MKINTKQYDSLTIKELEDSLGKDDVSPRFLIIYAFIVVLTVAFASHKISFDYIRATNVIEESISQTRPSYNLNQISVSAEVPYFIGVKEIDKTAKERAILVYGNSITGFNFLDAKSGKNIYSYDKMPGDGVLIKFSKNHSNILFYVNY